MKPDATGPTSGSGQTLDRGARWRRIVSPWTIAFVVPIAFAFWAALFPVTDTDIWWHLAAGRHMVEHGGVIREDPFSYPTASARWVDVHWLFQLFSYAVWSVAGVAGLVVAKAAVFALACALLLAGCYRRETIVPVGALAATVAYSVRFLILERPGVFSLLYIAAFLVALGSYRRTGDGRILLVPVGVQVLWANTQGIHALGPVIVLCHLAGEFVQRYAVRAPARLVAFDPPASTRAVTSLAATFLGTVAASFVSPYGAAGALLPWRLYARVEPGLNELYSWNVSENLPTWAIMQTDPYAMAHVTLLSLLAIASFVAARRRLHLPRVLVFGAFFYLGMGAERNVAPYVFVLVWVVAANLNASLDDLAASVRLAPYGRLARRGAIALGGGVVAVLSVMLAVAQAAEPSLTGLSPFRVPVEAARILKEETPDGNIFNSVRHGSYLVWELYQRRKVFIDGRLVIRTPEQFREYLAMLDDPSRFEACRATWSITRVVLPTAVFDRYLPLVKHLYEDPRWSVRYADGSSILFAYGEPRGRAGVDLASAEDLAAILGALEQSWGSQARVHNAARLHLARLLVYLGHPERAEQAMAGMDSPAAARLLARCRYAEGRLDEARALCDELLARDARDVACLKLAGRIHLDRGELAEALAMFRRVLDADPYDATAREVLEAAER